MATIGVGAVINVTFIGTLAGQRTMNSFPYRVSAAAGLVDYVDAMTDLFDALAQPGGLEAKYLACMPSNWGFTATWLQAIAPVRLARLVEPNDVTGQYAGSALTPNLQASITRKGEGASRQNIGGVRLPLATTVDAVLNGLIQTDMLEFLGALADEMKESILVADPAVTYRPLVGLPTPPAAPIDLFVTQVQPTSRVLRRRTVGLGE